LFDKNDLTLFTGKQEKGEKTFALTEELKYYRITFPFYKKS